MQKVQNTPCKRLFHLDVLRAIACLSVVMIHVSAEFVVKGTTGPDFWLGNLLDSLSRAGVPLFVMVSGALMLDESYQFTKKKWLGHIGRMVAFYAVWSTTYYFLYQGINLISQGEKIRTLSMFAQIITGHYHLWFVPMIIGLYLIVPLLRLWVKEENVRYVRYFLLLSVVFAFIAPHVMEILVNEKRVLTPIQTLWDNLNLQYTAGYTSYFILGWYLNRGVHRKKLVYALGALALCTTFAGTAIASVLLKMKTYPFYENATVNVLLYSIAIFTLCKSQFLQPKNPGGFFHKSVRFLGKYSLGIYAVHVYFISEVMWRFSALHTAVALPVSFALVLAVSTITSVIFKKIPLIKHIV